VLARYFVAETYAVRPRNASTGHARDLIESGQPLFWPKPWPWNWKVGVRCVATTAPVEKVLQVFDHLAWPIPAFTAEDRPASERRPWPGWAMAPDFPPMPCTMPAARKLRGRCVRLMIAVSFGAVKPAQSRATVCLYRHVPEAGN